MLEPKLTNAISELFGIPAESVRPETGRDSLPEWDSIGHLMLILSVEKAYGIRFPAAELGELTSSQKIQDALNRIRHAN
jgi:acyl carrier protein